MDVSATDIPEARQAPAEQPLARMRIWFAAFIAWMALLAGAAAMSFSYYEAGRTWAAGAWALALMCFYLSLCNALLPLPTGWIVMLAATDQVAPYAPPWQRVALVALCGGAATAMANLNEYHILSHRLGARLRDKLRGSRVYQWSIRWFDLAPFQTLMLIAFLPIPVDVVRWLAILRRYPRGWYALAYFCGRTPRYALFAAVAAAAKLNWWQILLVQAGIILLAFLTRWLTWRKNSPKAGRAEA